MAFYNLSKNINRNIPLFYILRAFELPIFILPVFYIFLTDFKGFDPVQTAFLLGFQEFALIFLEVPTGVVADKVSRKFSIALGFILNYFPVMIFPFVPTFILFIPVLLLKSVGKALISGADTSLLFDTLVDLKREDEYKKIIRRSRVLTFAVSTLCIFFGAHLYLIDPTIPFLLGFPFAMIAALAASLMYEPKVTTEGRARQEEGYISHTVAAIKYIIKDKRIVFPVIIFALVEGMAVQLKWIYSPIFVELGMGIGLIGGLTTILYILRMVISYINSVVPDNHWFNITIPALSSLFFFLMLSIFFNPYLAFITIAIEIFSQGMTIAFTQNVVHKRLDSSIRATAMSGINLLSSVAATIIIWGFGFFQQTFSIKFAVGYIAFLYLIVSIVGISMVRNQINESQE